MRYVCLLILFGLIPVLASAKGKDVAGASDHPLFKRHPNAWIDRYEQKAFDEYWHVLQPLTADVEEVGESLVGKVTRITYRVKSETSVAELFHSYKQSINQAGFREIYSCKNDKCGNRPKFQQIDRHMGYAPDFRYLAAASADDQVRVAILVMEQSNENSLVLNVVEREELNNQVGVVSPEELARVIDIQGRVVLDGIFFDHDRAELKAASEGAIKQVAAILRQDPALRLHVVGHTDGNGDFQHNLRLSRSRADAVIKHLIDAYGIASERLDAQGVASLAPVAANKTEEGRARNRRVELVKQ